LVQNSIEERVLEICKEKKEMAMSYEEGTEHKTSTGLNKVTMARLLGINVRPGR